MSSAPVVVSVPLDRWRKVKHCWTTIEQFCLKSSNANLRNSVSMVNDVLFEGRNGQGINVKTLSLRTMTKLIDEIENDVKNYENDKSNQNLPPAFVEMIQEPFKEVSNFKGGLDEKIMVWNDFKSKDSEAWRERIKASGPTQLLTAAPFWREFVFLRYDLIYGKLKNLFLSLGVEREDVDFFYQYIDYGGLQSIAFPTASTRFDAYKIIADHSQSASSPVLTYLMVYNCLRIIFTPLFEERGHELGNADIHQLSDGLIDHFIKTLANCGIFDTFVSDDVQGSVRREQIKTFKCKQYLFDNDLSPLTQFVGDTMKDIKVLEDMKESSSGGVTIDEDGFEVFEEISEFSVQHGRSGVGGAKRNGVENVEVQDHSRGGKFQLAGPLIQRMCYFILHDLSIIGKHSKESKLFHPSLSKMFKFIYNYSIFHHCNPINHSNDKKQNESFYLGQYFNLRAGYIFTFDRFDSSIKRFSIRGRTLLHQAAEADFAHFCDVLINKDDFDLNEKSNDGKTPFVIAQEHQHDIILSVMRNKKASQSSASVLSFMKKLDDESDDFVQQQMICKYFLMSCGIVVNEQNYSASNERIPNSINSWDDFMCGMRDFAGISSTSSKQDLSWLVDNVLKLLDLKISVSDFLLILCFEYCSTQSSKDMMRKFVSGLQNCVQTCLSDEFGDIRSYYYFKQYLLFSQIWFCKDLEGKLLYEMVSDLTDKILIKQKQFLWDSIKEQEKSNFQAWKQTCNFRVQSLDDSVNLRQDHIVSGIVPPQSEKELYLAKFTMSADDQYNILNEHNLKIYLTQCLTFSSLENNRFQKGLETYFATHKNATYSRAPVKTYDRCVTKSNTDYSGRDFPSVGSILDFLRCGVTYTDVNSLLNGLHKFVSDVSAGKIPFFLSILRVKNGFRDTSSWRSLNDANYFDIKFNMLYSSADGKTCQIVEVQFLLEFLMKAKKLGHKFYSIKRRKDFIDSVEHIVYNTSGAENYENFKIKVAKLVRDNNINAFAKHLFVEPHIMASLILDTPNGCGPLLFSIASQQRMKLFELFLCHVQYFNDVLLAKKEDKIFLEKYFNYNDCNYPITTGKIDCKFWGLDGAIGSNLKYIESIMKLPCFHGLNNTNAFGQQTAIFACMETNSFGYLSLRVKYFEKNREHMEASLRAGQLFEMLFKREDLLSAEWIKLLLSVYDKSSQVAPKKKWFQTCILASAYNQYAPLFKESGGSEEIMYG